MFNVNTQGQLINWPVVINYFWSQKKTPIQSVTNSDPRLDLIHRVFSHTFITGH